MVHWYSQECGRLTAGPVPHCDIGRHLSSGYIQIGGYVSEESASDDISESVRTRDSMLTAKAGETLEHTQGILPWCYHQHGCYKPAGGK